jgi:hypothetical protein
MAPKWKAARLALRREGGIPRPEHLTALHGGKVVAVCYPET